MEKKCHGSRCTLKGGCLKACMNLKLTQSSLSLSSDICVKTILSGSPGSNSIKSNARLEGSLGEVKVRVKLTNGADQVLVRRGFLSPDSIRIYETDALIDTGAIKSVLPVEIAQKLGLEIIGKTRARYANDSAESVEITEMVGIELHGRRTSEEMLVLGSEVLIGQTVLESLDLLVDCVNHRVIPNPEHPDQPIINVKGAILTRPDLRTEAL